MTAPKIIIAKDHPMFRAALVLTLRRLVPEASFLEVASAGELEQTLAQAQDVRLVLLDLRIPGARGLSSLVFLRGQYPEVPVAIISGGAYPENIFRARELGAAAFIPKSSTTDTITHALACVLRGETWFPPQDDSVAAPHQSSALDMLTPHQFRVLKYLTDGMMNKRIAEILGVSEGTVRAHVTRILRKLQVNTRTQAVLLVTELNLEKDDLEAGRS